MHCLNLRIMIVGGVLLGTTACASSEEWAMWREHPAHFASGHHLAFSLKNRFAPPLLSEPRDVAVAQTEGWWGGPFDVRVAALADVAGRWVGTWSGRGVMAPRTSRAEARFEQVGRWGEGRLLLADTLAAAVPEVVRWEGARGIRVVLDVGATGVVLRHPEDARLFRAELTLEGARLAGRVDHEGAPVRLVLARAR
ncbi:MAG: hypothetical protein A3G44_17205 [Candidatus Rokubacteria bacterium RIFCSPLOWO2_12_FULL_73_47]|nr:MAG: hypothetical protein A3G44_17205 [Candidatus Rokubacteria bacterium RIFCSPLOWO2_12_FULL_73_47]